MTINHDFKKFPELKNEQLAELEFISPHPQIKESFFATVIKVSDGDTIRVVTNFRDFSFPVRLLDINAPEMNEGGQTAQKWLESRILNKKVEVLVNPKNRVGKFGRLLGKVLSDGLDIGTEMLALGLVRVFGQPVGGAFDNPDKTFDLKKWF